MFDRVIGEIKRWTFSGTQCTNQFTEHDQLRSPVLNRVVTRCTWPAS